MLNTRMALCIKAALAVIVGSIIISAVGARIAHGDEVLHYALGVNGYWADGVTPVPDDIEGGLHVYASLSPHVMAVGSAAYGFQHSYQRGAIGARFTASNPDNPWFSVHVGGQYHFSSEPAIRSEGFAPEAAIGWVPWPQTQPAVVLTALGSYNIEANRASLTAGIRYELGRRGY